jgi:cytochrome b
LFGAQYVLHTVVGALLLQQNAFSGYWTERSVGLRWTALLALPLLWGWLAPGGHSLSAALFFGASILLYCIGIVRGTRFLLQKSTLSTVHLFAYLCTLEGAPLAWAFYGASHL